MNHEEFPTHLAHSIESIALSKEAHVRMREELSAYADLHATRVIRTPARASFFNTLVIGRFALSLLLMIGVVGGTAYASSDALPGDSLYPIKRYVSEPVQTALVPTAQGRAQWHATLAERRLEEAAQLAVTGKLDESTEQELSEDFAEHVEDSIAAATSVEEDTTSELQAHSDLEARITAHGEILTRVVSHLDTEGETSITAAARSMLATVQEQHEEVTKERLGTESSLVYSGKKVTLPVPEDWNVEVASSTTIETEPERRTQFIRATRIAREEEVTSILSKHQDLLDTLATSSPASSTPPKAATSTASTTSAATSSIKIDLDVGGLIKKK